MITDRLTAESLAARGKEHSPTAVEQWEQQRLAAMSQQQRFDEGLQLSSVAMAMRRHAPDHQPIGGKVFIL
ncbi:MAG: hypothetical protein DHS20C11_01780 [Lysobacteraceae bacterium]|nr:MAG: hypothetical protein DHS20C11_01780 [Xanthomonadaceae bacterium]